MLGSTTSARTHVARISTFEAAAVESGPLSALARVVDARADVPDVPDEGCGLACACETRGAVGLA
jgi:hypothetical protein